jgi:hypothetical protein
MTGTIVNRTGVKNMSNRQDKEIAIEKNKRIERAEIMKKQKIENEEIVKSGGKVPAVIRKDCFEMKKCYTDDFNDNPLRFRYVYVMISRTKTTGYFKTKRLGSNLYSKPMKVDIKYSNSRQSEYFKDGKQSIISNEPINWW